MPLPTIERIANAAVVRRPSAAEWPACRMLLPEAFTRGAAPQALLAFDSVGTLQGSAAFHHRGDSVHGLRLNVVRSHRRRGIGKQLVSAVLRQTAEREARELNAAADTLAEADAEPFLLACGFVRKSRVFTIVAEIRPRRADVKRVLGAGRLAASSQGASWPNLQVNDSSERNIAKRYATTQE
jgi:GNAT superfamily N-acetyltransferase